MTRLSGKHRFNAMDLLIILLCIGALIALILQGNLARTLGLEDAGSPTTYRLSLQNVSTENAALFRAGEKLTHPETGELLGVVRDVKRENTVRYNLSESGNLQKVSDTSAFTLTLTVDGTGKDTERGFLLNGSIFASPGDVLTVTPDESTPFEATVLPLG